MGNYEKYEQNERVITSNILSVVPVYVDTQFV